MSLTWYVRRLRSMSWREIPHRINEQVKRSVSRHRSYGWSAFPAVGTLRVVPGLAERLAGGMTPAFGAELRQSVDRLLDGHFSAHGVSWPKRDPAELFPDSLWQLDPISGKLWPGASVYCFDLNYRHERTLGDVKFVWDLNRLQFLQPLAAAVAVWQDARALRAIESAIRGWARCNPPFYGVSWNSGIELSLRAVSLVLTVSLCGDALAADVRQLVMQILSAHLHWLTRYPSLFSSANNHLVAEELGVFLIASVLPDLPQATAIRDASRRSLEAEAQLQIFADGAGAEQSPSYGAFTAEMLLVADLVARSFGEPMSPMVSQRLLGFSNFIGVLGDAAGRVPSIGDDDEGRVLTLSLSREYAYPGSVARAIAGDAGRPAPIARSCDRPELRDALFPCGAADQSPADGLHAFCEGGCTVVRETRAGRRVRFTLDHGPLGYLSIAAHGHADANAITLTLDDECVLVDPGTYLYHSGGEWRDWFRGTGAHNTLRLNGVDQSVISGAFNWSHKAAAELESTRTGSEWEIAASHDGYEKRFGVRHRRRVRAAPDGLTIDDCLVGHPTEALSEVVFQLAPGLITEPLGADGWRVVRENREVMRLRFSSPGRTTATAGGDAPGQGGWVSENFGDRVAAVRIVWAGTLPPEGLRTSLTWV